MSRKRVTLNWELGTGSSLCELQRSGESLQSRRSRSAEIFGFWSRAAWMLPSLDRFVDGRSLADTGSGVPSPPSPPHPPCLPDWDTTPGMPCLGPAPPSFELISEDESTTILAFAVMGLVAVIGLIAFARERSRELLQGNKAPRLCGVCWA